MDVSGISPDQCICKDRQRVKGSQNVKKNDKIVNVLYMLIDRIRITLLNFGQLMGIYIQSGSRVQHFMHS